MATQPTPTSVEVTHENVPLPTPVRAHEVLYVAGKLPQTITGSMKAGELMGPYHSEAEIISAIGNKSSMYPYLHGVYDNVPIPTYIAAEAHDADQDTIDAALAKIHRVEEVVTLVAQPENLAAGTTTASLAQLQVVCEAVQAHATGAAPMDTVANAVTFAKANGHPRVMLVFGGYNGTGNDYDQGEGWYMGAAIRRSRDAGRQASIEHAHVNGIHRSLHELSHSPRSSVSTDVRTLVGAYLGTIVRHRGVWEIQGSDMPGLTDGRQKWPVARVVDHLEHVLEETGISWLGRTDTTDLLAVATALEVAGNQLVTTGELIALSVLPAGPDINTAAERANERAHFDAVAVVPVGLHHIIINLRLSF